MDEGIVMKLMDNVRVLLDFMARVVSTVSASYVAQILKLWNLSLFNLSIEHCPFGKSWFSKPIKNNERNMELVACSNMV